MFSKTIVMVLCAALVLPGSGMAQTASPVTKEKTQQETSTPAAPPKPQPLTADEEKALAERSEEPGREVAGGALTTQQLTYIVIALAAAVLVLIFK